MIKLLRLMFTNMVSLPFYILAVKGISSHQPAKFFSKKKNNGKAE